ncbi:hypothetical protein M9Y10_021626 [Tritrichomonas musculus]|uniref:Small-subunit processome Utp12 domain-containing protein n=1 Tax=Tritrichomonas musculus TaxID=1915356 RepID=A0ABR2KTA2_9EUKA
MQNLHLGSPIVGITSNKLSFALCTEEGIIYIGNSKNCSIDIEISLPARSEVVNNLLWSKDGDCIYASAGDTIYFFKPEPNANVLSIQLPQRVENIFSHCDGFSAIAYLANNTLCLINPKKDFTPNLVGPLPETERIISVLIYQRTSLVLIVDGQTPQIRVIDPIKLNVIKSFNIEKYTTAIEYALSSPELGIVVFMADGFWTCYNIISPNGKNSNNQTITSVSGKSSPALYVNVSGQYLCASCDDCVKIFDLKFDAELQSIDVRASKAILFQSNIISIFDNEVHFRDWKGLKKTTTRDLILHQLSKINQAKNRSEEEDENDDSTKGEKAEKNDIVDCEEIKIEFDRIPNNTDQPVQTEVVQLKPDSKFKSVSSVVDNIMNNRSVPIPVKLEVLKKLNDSKYDDVRDIALFHLSTSIPFDDVLNSLIEKKTINTVIMLKKVEPLNGSQVATFIRTALQDIELNEIVLAHFLTQPLTEDAAIEASKILNPDEVDVLLIFLAKLLASRRYWRDFDASLSALDAVNWWGSILIKNNITVLNLQNKTEGLKKLQVELLNETRRIETAGACWSIVETITEEKREPIPPSFMYLVETLNIPE